MQDHGRIGIYSRIRKGWTNVITKIRYDTMIEFEMKN